MKCLLKTWNDNEKLIFNWLVKQTQDQQLAQDIMQDVFLSSMKNPNRFCNLDDAKSWLFKVVKNRYIDVLRKQILNEEIDDNVPSHKIEQDTVVQMQTCLPIILPMLSPSERSVIELCDLQGLTQKQYAQQYDLSSSAVKARLLRARKKLKTLLIEQCQVKKEDGVVCCFKGINT